MFLTIVFKDFPLIIFVILTGVPGGKLGLNMFSDESYVDLSKQGVFYSSIEGADDLASQRYGNHDDYRISEGIDCTAPSNLILPQ